MLNCLLTNDVETTSIWFNTLRPETAKNVVSNGLPLLLDIYEKYNIKTTFFFNIDIVSLYPRCVKMVVPYGHEVASHGYSHEVDKAFDVLTYEQQLKHLSLSKKILEDLSQQEVITFRAPALRVNSDTPQALLEAGYKIDSSVPSQRFDFFLSFGSKKKLKWLTAPRLPYHTRLDDLARKGDSPIVEVPLSSTFIPYVGTTMRLFPRITKIQHHLLFWESLRTSKPIVFDIHPNELIDESHEIRVIKRRTNNLLKYFFADLLRSKLKIKNLGLEALPLYESEIKYFMDKGFKFSTIKGYCKQNGLLTA